MTSKPAVKVDPRKTILAVAIALFAERGLDAVSIRDIAATSKVNIGAINYYFGSKDKLISEIYRTLLYPVQQERIARLEELEANALSAPPHVEQVLRALIEPAVRRAMKGDASDAFLPRLMSQAYSVSRPFLDEELAEFNDHVSNRFVTALTRAAPEVDSDEMFWRYQMLIGSMIHLITFFQTPNRSVSLPKRALRKESPDHRVDQLIAVFSPGIMAPAPRDR